MSSDVIQPRPIPVPVRVFSAFGLIPRIVVLAVLFAVELTAISIWLDNDSLAHRGVFLGVLYIWGAWIIRGVIAYAAIFVAAAWLRSREALSVLSNRLVSIPVSKRLLAGHFCAMAAFLVLSQLLYASASSGWDATLLAIVWFVTGISAILLATFAFIPPSWFFAAVSHTGRLWLYTLLVVTLACVTGNAIRSLWQSTNQITFVLVELLLKPFVSNVVANPATKHIGTTSFAVDIAPECSGFEGVGLILGFSLLWLAVFRRELRFPHAFLLVPAGVASIFFLNAVRIAALILIGNAGASGIALGGFHSQAGWISFNAVALAFCVAAGKSSWLNVKPQEATSATATTNPSLPYLLPFVAIVLVGMLSRAATQDFEWLYPLRLLAAVTVLWSCRRTYRTLDWKFSWYGPALGALVFFMWIGLDRSHIQSRDAMPAALAAVAAWQRISWLVCRIAAAVITVPIAEELAFRGFLIRRFVSRDFDLIDLRRFTWPGLLVSSVAFGLLHGDQWLAGTLAGLVYAAALLRRGRIGEAVAAHGATNALLAIYVLAFNKWHLW